MHANNFDEILGTLLRLCRLTHMIKYKSTIGLFGQCQEELLTCFLEFGIRQFVNQFGNKTGDSLSTE